VVIILPGGILRITVTVQEIDGELAETQFCSHQNITYCTRWDVSWRVTERTERTHGGVTLCDKNVQEVTVNR
jgi:hypothetical protein